MPSGFQNYGPYQAQQQEILRRQKLAQMLQQQSADPITPPQGGTFAAPISPLQVAAKLYQGYQGGSMQKEAQEQQKKLGETMQQERAAALAKALQASQAQPAQPMQMDAADNVQTPAAPAMPADPSRGLAALAQGGDPAMMQYAPIFKMQQDMMPKRPEPFTLAPGAIRYGPDGKPIAAAPPKPPEPFTLAPGAIRYGPDGKPIAASPEKVPNPTAAYTNVQPDGKGGFIGLSKATGRMEQVPTTGGAQGAGQLGADAIDQAAYRYAIDGTLPPNLGRGIQGATNTAAILHRAAEIAKESGNSGEATRLQQISNKASSTALGQLTKQKNMVLAFEKNAVLNADLALQASEQVDRLGSPVIDRWLQAGRKSIAGDPNVAKLDAAMRTFVNEYARVTTSVTGGGVTSDTARKEIEDLLKGAHTKEQVRAVIGLMKQEMENRRHGYEQQEAELRKTITIGGNQGRRATDQGHGPLTPQEQEELNQLRQRFGR